MLQDRQVERTVLKVARLADMYSQFVVKAVIEPKVTVNKNGKEVQVTKGYKWGKDFKTETFRFTAEGLSDGEKYYLFADTGAPEHLVMVNGRKVGILDYIENAFEPPARIHKYIWLEGLKNGDEVSLEGYYSHSLSGLNPYDEPFTFSYATLDEDRPYNQIGLAVMREHVKELCDALILLNKLYSAENDRFAKAKIEKIYIELFKILPLEKQCPDEECARKAVKLINDFMKAERELVYVGIVGHSHLDTAWLWTVEETRRKLMRTVSNAVTLLKRYKEYSFFMSTVLYIKWIEEDDPKLFRDIKQLVKEGRIELNGASWVECDGNLTGSEAFCRQFVRGKRYLREKFDFESDTFWLPDTFGYSAALPQIMKGSEVKYFLTTKLSWNDTNQFPYETFIWKGIDGSEIPVHFNTIHTWIDEESVAKRINEVKNPRESDSMLVAYGFGDGGGGPSEDMVKRAIFTEKNCKNAVVEHTTVSKFMERVSKKELPTYFGELYLELHRGTYTTNHNLKAYNRRLEEALHDAELLSVLNGESEAKELTDRLYDVLMLNQFHDILPGTCIAEATDVALAEQREALKEVKSYIRGKGRCAYFNTLGFERREILPSDAGQTYEALDGIRTVAPYSFKAYSLGKKEKSEKIPFTVDGGDITTPYHKVKIENGVITSLVYEGRELADGGLNLIRAFEDIPLIYDNWDIDADYSLKEKAVQLTDCKVVSVGAYLLVIRAKYDIAEGSSLVTDIKFRYDSPVIEFENRLCAGDKHTLIRAEFDTTLFSPVYKCETQFGHVSRNCYDRDKSDIAKFEVCSHKWTDLSEYNVGISLLSDTKYGVSCRGGRMGITLHKSGTHPDARGDEGEFSFRYAIYPHTSQLGMDTVKEAYAFNYAPPKTARRDFKLPFAVNCNSVVVETVKQGEDGGVVLRMYEAMGASDEIVLTAKGREIVECNILEDERLNLGADEVKLAFKPFEIKTIKLN